MNGFAWAAILTEENAKSVSAAKVKSGSSALCSTGGQNTIGNVNKTISLTTCQALSRGVTYKAVVYVEDANGNLDGSLSVRPGSIDIALQKSANWEPLALPSITPGSVTKDQLQITYDPDSTSHPGYVYFAVISPSEAANFVGANAISAMKSGGNGAGGTAICSIG